MGIADLNTLQGKQKQQKRTTTFFEFCNADHGILLSTDVAARGLDIPQVDWNMQYDPPDDPRDYIHRVGRTARAGKVGKSLMFLLPSELGFLRYLKEAKVPLNEYSFPENKISNVQSQVRLSQRCCILSLLTYCLAGEAASTELCVVPGSKGGISFVFASIRFILAQEDLRCQQARSRQGRKGVWFPCTSTSELEDRRRSGRVWANREEAAA